jgi:hypothetical protein
MPELFPDELSIATTGADPGRRKAAAHEAHGAQTFAVTSAPAATPIADMVEAMLSGGIPVEVVGLAERTAELARGGTDPVAERRRAFDRERKRRASAKARPAESQLLNWRHGQGSRSAGHDCYPRCGAFATSPGAFICSASAAGRGVHCGKAFYAPAQAIEWARVRFGGNELRRRSDDYR